MTDLGCGEGATVGPQAQAYQIRRALQFSFENVLKFSLEELSFICAIYRQRLVQNANDIVPQGLYWHLPVSRAKEYHMQTTHVGTQYREDRQTNIIACLLLGG